MTLEQALALLPVNPGATFYRSHVFVCTDEEFRHFKKRHSYYDADYDRLTTVQEMLLMNENLLDEEEWYDWDDWGEMIDKTRDKSYDYWFYDEVNMLSYRLLRHQMNYHERHFTSPSGDKMVCFGFLTID